MSKITFRADDDLVARIEAYDASKSEVMREALRAYLDEGSSPSDAAAPAPMGQTLDALVRERVDTLVDQRIEAVLAEQRRTDRERAPQDVNVTVNLADERQASEAIQEAEASALSATERRESDCSGCGETLDDDAVYCPNCGEKANHRVFCDCGDELRSDWSFCPGCGRRTPAADVLERS
ncbi:double zinc ribbon domain-containing protein [Halomarina oriensis]|uniref:Zinc-ribbon domain-containing protein n=1 Tax=Halomarina oriensis TaxID=671145 RepID=A0A6B0GP77_9EURY|nr:zinc ribbon domain-containing protein [Halomarina oriensis]MWG35307.1 zinc-ribbon domain-containing protein [Halomarina oriensis]